MKRRLLLTLPLTLGLGLFSQQTPRLTPGIQPDGTYLLPSGWRIKPVGTQIIVDTLPIASLVTPDKKYLLVLNGGYNPPSISVIDIATAKELSRTGVPDGWLGLTVTKAGDKVYVGGGAKAAIYEFALANGQLTAARAFPIPSVAGDTRENFIGDVQFDPDYHLLYAAELYHDDVVVVNPASGIILQRIRTARRPYRILFHPNGKSFFLSSWADGSIVQYDAARGTQIAVTRVAPHTTDMVWKAGDVEDQPEIKGRIFVAAANTNNVYALGVRDSGDLARLETINLALSPRQPAGMTPSGLGLSSDGMHLFVACSDANAAAIVDISEAKSRIVGYVPTGWYPTSAFGLPDGRIGILNGKGLRSYANPEGPNPLNAAGSKVPQFVARMQTGSLQLVDMPDDTRASEWTRNVISYSPYRDESLDNTATVGGPVHHVVYIIKENRTYDQVLGDMKEGNGDPSLVLFGEQVTPNLHKLAREFVLIDNLYVNAEVSADGHNWSTAAIAPDYTQRLWPSQYGGRRKIYDFEGNQPANFAPAGYIWTGAVQAGLTIRNYGEFAEPLKPPKPDGTQVEIVKDPVLAKYTDMEFRPFDVDYPDVDRAREFLSELKEFEQGDNMPNLIIMRLGNDHTNGTTAGKIAPLSSAADNDLAAGMIVEAISRSKFWADTAIFIIEDDAQNGPDHVDSHRSPAWLVSPFAKRHAVDNTMYSQASVLHTIEIMLGLKPMTVFDAGARPMFNAFTNTANPAPYTAEKARTSLEQRNPPNGQLAERSRKLNFDVADDIDDDELNAILWEAIKGPNVPMPAPTRSRFAR
jgi:DNA-binding beta-propeller fold protein YncE